MKKRDGSQATLKIDLNSGEINCNGLWTLHGIAPLHKNFAQLAWPETDVIILNASHITQLDTAGAWLLNQVITLLKKRQHKIELRHFTKAQETLLSLIETESSDIHDIPIPKPPHLLETLGKNTVDTVHYFFSFITFIGEVVVNAFRWFIHPSRIQWQLLWKTIETAGYQALPIIGLLSFLIGVVLAYQASQQLRTYGANIYIVNLLGISLLREFSPLITAIIIAGRSGSAFTAQIGTMKINQEVDSLEAMGLSPVERLALQKFFGLLIVLPLLTVWSDITGLIGGMVMSKKMLAINYHHFLTRFKEVIPVKHYLLGMLKTPFFAMIIACVGCYQGFQVKGSAESIGNRTTTSVVQAIFYIICADALFSILYNWYKL